MTKIAVIGGGKIGEALIAGLVSGGVSAKDVHVSNRRAERGGELTEEYGIVDFTDNRQAIDGVDVVFLCVKPKDTTAVLAELSDTIDNNAEDTTVISMAAGVPLKSLEDVVSAGTPVVRVMPNTPMLVGRGMCAVSGGRFVSDAQLEQVCDLLDTVGDVVVVEENQMDAVTAMSGSSPAYLFLVAEAMIDGGVNLGLPRVLASRLAVSTLTGAAHMMLEGDLGPSELRANVCSPGGTTIAAVRALEESGIRAAFYRATQVCAQRSAEIGRMSTGSAGAGDDDED
ncbi:pyrroline-5-carboxylate reductase [Corynebacterium sp. P7202]|uniref:Pyrroline-5-carboxylate reductase n=1 Tax=Corynebacterium pygosceleis TaxID=2800406 RepID=A0A9Q4GIG8_9CORY|nr:pyrroline-5-carboxylate reductase [Corynebacterium pygosceleis]MCK7637425.1 pyrroline-5-carboxylate reductase [Corynebacterium pygosceleis]MCX7468246.1 pyrroline-5-carboxylate reductase [Corynebacterium pygosceleis]